MLPSGVSSGLSWTVLIRKKWRNSVTNAEAYNSFASIGSDHRVVTACIRLSLRADSRATPKKVKYDWSKPATDPDVQDRYTLEIKKRYSILAENSVASATKVQLFHTG